MCINYVHSDRFLIVWETFFVQCSYAMLVLLRSVSSHTRSQIVARRDLLRKSFRHSLGRK